MLCVAAAFTNTTAGSDTVSRNGRWLGDPVVVLRANGTSALLQLAAPVYDADADTVTFQVRDLESCDAEVVSLWHRSCYHRAAGAPMYVIKCTCELQASCCESILLVAQASLFVQPLGYGNPCKDSRLSR